ncbi:hypothetical protein [Rufibacter latericius]|uniref:hypothetical protein n=1 Tax=Rufibacter latericius TaxID=2487040 RepID=UPI000F629208|nr:hypothetical protein [Rufibacter latericius]
MSDTLAHHFEQSIFCKTANQPGASWNKYQFWNPQISWSAKWKNGDPKQGEAFPLSSTVLVFLTDGWHLFNFIQYTCLTLALVVFKLQEPMVSLWVDVALMAILFRVVFQFCYSKVFVKTKPG